jgi:DnaK suppressor protein
MKQRKEFFDKIKEQLEARQMELSKDLENLSHEEITDKQVMDSGDEALSLSMEKLQSSLEKTELDELHLIDQALERLEKGEYGVCTDCSEIIAQNRLKYYPYAARCIVCQEAFENS